MTKLPFRPTSPVQTVTFRAGGREYTVEGVIQTLDLSHGFSEEDSEVRLYMHGKVSSRQLHSEPHIKDIGSIRHPAKRCVCKCKECLDFDPNGPDICICKECGCS